MAVVTGGSRGIGREIALGLARASANVVVIARDRTDGERTCGELARAGSPDPVCLEADLSERSQVRALAGHLAERLDRIDVLVNNAAVVSPRRRETEDGIELTLAVGHLAAFHLTERVHPLLLRGAPARVVNVTSGIVHRADLALDDLQSVASYDPLEAYGRSKLMTLAWTLDLARRWAPDGIDVHAADPGVADTGTHRDFPGRCWPGSGWSSRGGSRGPGSAPSARPGAPSRPPRRRTCGAARACSWTATVARPRPPRVPRTLAWPTTCAV